jgi:peptide/nickel transport system permease protein
MVALPFLWPGEDAAFPLGTDMLGRDLAAGIFHGARVSLLIGAVATLVSLLIGVGIGAPLRLLRRPGGCGADARDRALPDRPALPLRAHHRRHPAALHPTINVAIGITAWPSLARLVRAEVLKLRHGELVQPRSRSVPRTRASSSCTSCPTRWHR